MLVGDETCVGAVTALEIPKGVTITTATWRKGWTVLIGTIDTEINETTAVVGSSEWVIAAAVVIIQVKVTGRCCCCWVMQVDVVAVVVKWMV